MRTIFHGTLKSSAAVLPVLPHFHPLEWRYEDHHSHYDVLFSTLYGYSCRRIKRSYAGSRWLSRGREGKRAEVVGVASPISSWGRQEGKGCRRRGRGSGAFAPSCSCHPHVTGAVDTANGKDVKDVSTPHGMPLRAWPGWRRYYCGTPVVGQHVRFFHSLVHYPFTLHKEGGASPSTSSPVMVSVPIMEEEVEVVKEEKASHWTPLPSAISSCSTAAAGAALDSLTGEGEDSDVVLSDYPSSFVQFLSHHSVMDHTQSIASKEGGSFPRTLEGGTMLSFPSHCDSLHHSRERDTPHGWHTLQRKEEHEGEMWEGQWNYPTASTTRTHSWNDGEEDPLHVERGAVQMGSRWDAHGKECAARPFRVEAAPMEEGETEGKAMARWPVSDSSLSMKRPFTHINRPMRSQRSTTSPLSTVRAKRTTALMEMESPHSEEERYSLTTTMASPSLILSSFRSSLTPSVRPSPVPSSAGSVCHSHESTDMVSADIVDLVTDAFDEHRKKAIAERQRFLHALTHPIPTDYTYGGKLVPPPPFHFGRITHEAKALAERLLVQPSYSLVVQAGTRYDPSLHREGARTGHTLSPSSSTSALGTVVTNEPPSCSVEISSRGGKRDRVMSSKSGVQHSLAAGAVPRHTGSRAHRDPSNIFAHHNYFFEINDLYQEVVLVGRASAGKSSLLNAILNQPRMAKTSSTPHTTRSISFYQSCTKEEMRRFYSTERHQLVKLPGKGLQLTFVDIPGFGIEGMSDRWRDETIILTDSYFGTRRSVNTVLFCLDVDKGLTKVDIKYFNWLENVQGVFFVVLTKCDSVPHSRICAVMHQVYALITKHRKKFRKVFPFILPTSAFTGENIDELRGLIMETSGMMPGKHLREILKKTQQDKERDALREEWDRLEEAREINYRHALEYFQEREKKDQRSLSVESPQEAQGRKIHPCTALSFPPSLVDSTRTVHSFVTDHQKAGQTLAALEKAEDTSSQEEERESTSTRCRSTPHRPSYVLSKGMNMEGGETRDAMPAGDGDGVKFFPSSSSSSSSPSSVALTHKDFLKWRHAHPHTSHALGYDGHRVRLHSGLNSPHILAVSEAMTATLRPDGKTNPEDGSKNSIDKKAEEEITEVDPSSSEAFFPSTSSSFPTRASRERSLPSSLSSADSSTRNGAGGGAVSAFLDQFQHFQQLPHASPSKRIRRTAKGKDSECMDDQQARKGMRLEGSPRRAKEAGVEGRDTSKQESAIPAWKEKQHASTARRAGSSDTGRGEKCATVAPLPMEEDHSSSPSRTSQPCLKPHRAPFFAQDETGRLAAFTAGKRSGPSVVSLDSSVYHRKAEYKGKALGLLLQKENPEAPWHGLDSLRRKIDEAKEQLLLPTLSSASAVNVVHQPSRDEKKSRPRLTKMNRKDREAYLRYAGRLTSSFEEFVGEVACTKYMTEVRQAKTLRSREQMHFNATGKINYRSMPKGLWKEYGSRNPHKKNTTSSGNGKHHPVEAQQLCHESSSHSRSDTVESSGARPFPSSSSFSTSRVLGCEVRT